MIYCKKCVYPIISVNLEIGKDGVCSSCKSFDEFNALTANNWQERKKNLKL